MSNPQNCAVIDLATNMVTNVIVADPAVDPHSEGSLLIALPEGVGIGWKHNEDGTFTDMNFPPPVVEPTPAPQPTLADLQAQLAALTAQIQALAGQNV
jgi:hypothetical protein